jgi:hypothetical protein
VGPRTGKDLMAKRKTVLLPEHKLRSVAVIGVTDCTVPAPRLGNLTERRSYIFRETSDVERFTPSYSYVGNGM